MIPTDLFSYAYIPAWYEQLYELSQLAAPEPWRFRQPTYETQNDQNPILERYINQVFRKQSVKYNCVELTVFSIFATIFHASTPGCIPEATRRSTCASTETRD